MGKFQAVQSLRFFAAALVLCSHIEIRLTNLGQRYGHPFPPLSFSGHFGVDIFFVISGFIMTWLTYERFGYASAVRQFALDRMTRIVPLYWIFTTVSVVGDIRSMYLDDRNVRGAMVKHLDERSRLVTDGAQTYKFITDKHESVDHSKYEFVRGDVHTNTLEGFFSIFKRGLVGVYQHMDKKHLDRYLAEFDFRMNTRAKLGIDDTQRTGIAVEGFAGKRLTYR